MNIPDPSHSGSLRATGSLDYRSPQSPGTFLATPPPRPTGEPGARSQRKRVTGLLPAQAGATFPLVLREPAKVRVNPADVSRARADKRTAERAAKAAEAALLVAAGNDGRGVGTPAYVDALKASRDASDLVAAYTRKLAELDAASASRPIRVVLAQVREPSEVADVVGNDGVYVCLHDSCKGQRWEDEASMRRSHPGDNELARLQQCHPFAVLCEAPLDPLDPDGEIVGLVATVGRDGTTLARTVAQTEEREEDIDTLRAENASLAERLARLEALLSDGGKAKKG